MQKPPEPDCKSSCICGTKLACRTTLYYDVTLIFQGNSPCGAGGFRRRFLLLGKTFF
jgi:hypothetical protein